MNKSGLILMGEPMGLLIAQNEGTLDNVKGYDLAVAGAEFNVAVGVSRLEHRVTYITKLGEDPFGKRIIHTLDENKIGREFVAWSTSNKKTGFMLKSRVTDGDPDIFYFRAGSAASTLAPKDVEKVDFSNYSHIHLTGIFPALSESTLAAVYLMFEKAREDHLFITFDPNLRPQLWPDQETMKLTLNNMATKADIVMPGIAEGKILVGSENPKEISDFYLSKGVKAVIVKCGPTGAYLATADKQCMIKGYQVDKVVDTVGAGDGFAVGVITAIMEGLSLEEAVNRGNAIGAIQVTCRGDNEGLPDKGKLETFMKSF